MEAKKSKKADLEKKKGFYLEIGLVTILAFVLLAFNLRSSEKKDSGLNTKMVGTELEEEIMQTEEDQPEEQQPEPEQPEPEAVTELEVVDNNAQIENEFTGFNAEDDANTRQEDIVINTDAPEETVDEEEIFVFVEENPEYPGGESALYEFLGKNIQYPDLARDNGITGTVVIKFVVEKDGKITRATILRDIGGGCGKEALRVVNAMPKWKPGKQSGRAVRSEFMLPVQFELH